MTKEDAIAAIEKHSHLKGKSLVKKDSTDTSKYEVKEVVALPFGQKISDLKQVTNPNNFSGHDWQVYAVMEPAKNFFSKVDVTELDKRYRVL